MSSLKEFIRGLNKQRRLFPSGEGASSRPGGRMDGNRWLLSGKPGRGFIPALIFSTFLASLFGLLTGALIVYHFRFPSPAGPEEGPLSGTIGNGDPSLERRPGVHSGGWEKAVTRAVEKASPSVVSIVVTKDVAVMEKQYSNPLEEFKEFFEGEPELRVPRYERKGTRRQEVGGGTGFIVSEDGLIITNKHVVADKKAHYMVFTNQGEKYEARVLDRDPLQDIAFLKIEADGLPVITLGSSKDLKMGQTVIAIGNVLGEFRNSVSVGVVSGLKRNITAAGGGMSETLRGIIQTDAAINQGNSGGPLLDLEGGVVGINTAMATGAENVGFAIPVGRAKRDMERLDRFGEIVYAFLGIYYTTLTPALSEEYGLSVEHGAWVGRDGTGARTETAIFSGSPADKAGLKRDDIILRFGGEKISLRNSLAEIIMNYSPGDRVTLEVQRKGEKLKKEVTLVKREE